MAGQSPLVCITLNLIYSPPHAPIYLCCPYCPSCLPRPGCWQVLLEKDWRSLPVPDSVFLALVRMVDLLQKLDNLKDMKASLNNDFARFKRCGSTTPNSARCCSHHLRLTAEPHGSSVPLPACP